MSFDTTSALTALHPKLNDYFSFFFENYEPNQDLKLSFNSFKLAFQCMSHLLANGFTGMAFEHFQDYFHLEDLVSGFPQLFQLCFHITQGHIPPQIARVLGVAHSHDQVFRWSLSHCSGGNIVSTHNSMKLLQHIFPHTNLESQLRVVVKQ
jgi:hypothetical protein